MPKSTSALKAARSSEKKQLRNRSMKSATKSYIAKAERLIQGSEQDAAKVAVVKAISALDKAAKKKIIHPNTASRRKSRLMKKLNKTKMATTTKTAAA